MNNYIIIILFLLNFVFEDRDQLLGFEQIEEKGTHLFLKLPQYENYAVSSMVRCKIKLRERIYTVSQIPQCSLFVFICLFEIILQTYSHTRFKTMAGGDVSQRIFILRYKQPLSKLHIAITFWYNQSLSFPYAFSRVGAWIPLVQKLTVHQLELATLILRSKIEMLA